MLFLVGLALFSWIFTEFAGYGVHRFMHLIDAGAHNTHHRLYPPDSYVGQIYESSSSVDGRIQDLLYSVPGVLYTGLVWWFFGFAAFAVALGVVVGVAYLNQYLHDAFHIQNHWLERFNWFWRLRASHWVHHVEDRNFGIASLLWDRVFGSYRHVGSEERERLFREWGRAA